MNPSIDCDTNKPVLKSTQTHTLIGLSQEWQSAVTKGGDGQHQKLNRHPAAHLTDTLSPFVQTWGEHLNWVILIVSKSESRFQRQGLDSFIWSSFHTNAHLHSWPVFAVAGHLSCGGRLQLAAITQSLCHGGVWAAPTFRWVVRVKATFIWMPA